ncbi:MAG: NUDIX hydrolase [Candidatus Saccharibacteria bacterium]|nr:MAG: NUDIX hydrolase [Candidatus Saccharibacteria bacterium]
MKQVAKVVIIDSDNRYLLMKRANHPTFLNDPDLPGGTIEDGEDPLGAALREVLEEANILLVPNDVRHVYTGNEYSAHGTQYSLYIARVLERPRVTISWEHASFAWVDRQEFLSQAHAANDTFMHMVHDTINNLP